MWKNLPYKWKKEEKGKCKPKKKKDHQYLPVENEFGMDVLTMIEMEAT